MPLQPGIQQVSRLAASKVITANTVLASLGLPVPIGVNAKAHLRYWIPYSEAGSTAGAKFQLVVPAGGLNFGMSILDFNGVSHTLDSVTFQTASAAFNTPAAGAGNYVIELEADIQNGLTPGTIDLQVAQQVSDPGALTFLLGAFVFVSIVG